MLHYHKGSGERSLGLWWRPSSPSHTRLYWLWIPSASYSGYTHHQPDHQHDQEKWNQWVVSFPQWRVAQLLACWWAGLLIQRKTGTNQPVDPANLNAVVKTAKKEEVDTFLSKIIHGWTKTLLLGNNMHVMTQSLKRGDGPHLPHCLSVVITYTKVVPGSKWVTNDSENLMVTLIAIAKGIKCTKWLLQMWYPQWK